MENIHKAGSNEPAFYMCVGHDTHLAGESPVTGVTAKCSEPQAESREAQVKEAV